MVGSSLVVQEDSKEIKMNDDLCQDCQEREHNTMLTCDPRTGEDLDLPLFLCFICDAIRMMQNGYVQQENGNWHREPQINA